MTVNFSIATWKDIQRICGSATQKRGGYEVLSYIHFVCEDGYVTATGANSYSIGRLNCVAAGQTPPDRIEFLLPPIRPLIGTQVVSVSPYSSPGKHTVSCIDAKGKVTDVSTYTATDEKYIDADRLIEKTHSQINQLGGGRGSFSFAVDPKILIAALEGFKACENVVFNFSNYVNGFSIRPGDDLYDAEAVVMPYRVMGERWELK